MDATRGDPSRVGAVWVTATGSFLLFAAAVVLVAVRWDSIPDGVKLGGLAAVSGTCLLAGRPDGSPLARRVPAAAGVLFHLGAFLAPVTAASVLRHLEVPTDALLLSLGAGSAALFHLLGRVERSVVLTWSSLAATVVATVGLGGLTPVPASAWLVALAAVAFAARQDAAAVAWSTLATMAPLAAMVLGQTEVDVLDPVAGTGLAPGLVGLAAAAVLVGLTHRLRKLPLLGLAATALAGGVATTGAQLEPAAITWWLAAAAAFVLLELATMLLREDPFWKRPLDGMAVAVEAVALLAAPAGLLWAFLLPIADEIGDLSADRLAGAVFGLTAVGWLLADLRRHQGEASPGLDLLVGGGATFANFGLVGALLGAVAAGTASIPVTAATAGVLAVLLVVSGRAGSPVLVPALVMVSVTLLDVSASAEVTALVAMGGALLLAVQATLHGRDVATALALLTVVPTGYALDEIAHVTGVTETLVAGLLLAFALGVVLDGARSGDGLGWIPRLAGTAMLLGLADEGATTVAVVSGTYVVLSTVEWHRRREELPLFGVAVGLPLLASSLGVLAGLELAQTALVLSALAVPAAALGHGRTDVRMSMLMTAASLAAAGLGLATLDPAVLGSVLIVDGAVLLAAGLLLDQVGLTIAGGAIASLGVWQHLDLQGIESVDAYALPVAVVLWLVATRMADDTVSSWVTHAPAVALAGGTALAERIGGGPGQHAVLAGLVGIVAVMEGGGRRLAAPLLLGTGLLVGLTVHETTAVTAGVPTWAWLASGGTLLVGAGLAMERHELGPVETGRRLVDVVQENFR
jgi:hypothetical protein